MTTAEAIQVAISSASLISQEWGYIVGVSPEQLEIGEEVDFTTGHFAARTGVVVRVMAESTVDEFLAQVAIDGRERTLRPDYRHFYRIEACD